MITFSTKFLFRGLSFGSSMRGGEQETSHGGNYYDLTANILPSLGARSFANVTLRRFVISPFDPRYRIWKLLLVILVLYTAWISPFEFGFLNGPKQPISIIDNIVNSFFAIDIILRFFVAYLDQKTHLLVDEHKKIAKNYVLSHKLIFDIISIIPCELVLTLFPASKQAYGVFSMFRLWRLHRLCRLFFSMERHRKFNYFWVRFIKLTLVTVFAIHCAGCFCYHIAAHYHDSKATMFGSSMQVLFTSQNLWTRYIMSVYWAITTMSTVGYGDLHPVNEDEMLFTIAFMLFNLGLTAYLIGNMTNLVVHGSSRTRKYRENIHAAYSFAQRHQLPLRVQEQMLAHISLKYRTDSEGLQQQEILDSLPKAIRSSISIHLFYSIVDAVYLFRGVSSDLLFQLVSEMKAEYYSPNEDVILQNEAPTDFYIIVHGAVDLLRSQNATEQVVARAKKGDICGEIAVLCYKPQPYTVRTKRLCQLLRINRTSFLNIIKANVGDGNIIMNNLLQHLKDNENDAMKQSYVEIETIIGSGSLDLPLSLCFAAIRGDDQLMLRLLKRGLDPNELETGGKAAMHIAAKKGNEKCVHILLDSGANPNCRDEEGSTPLWEAMLGGHDSVVKLLRQYGANISAGDVGLYACIAAEQNNISLLREIVCFGGDVTLPAVTCTVNNYNGRTALHVAVDADNINIIEYLLEQGANLDLPDDLGWTPRSLAEQQAKDYISVIFKSKLGPKPESVVTIPENEQNTVSLVQFTSAPELANLNRHNRSLSADGSIATKTRLRRRANNFRNSIFGVLSDVQGELSADTFASADASEPVVTRRVIISFSQEEVVVKKVVALPSSYEELLHVIVKKFGFFTDRILMECGAEIDSIEVIRDGDHLVLIKDDTN